MRRINPKTKKPFQRNDVREDGYIFVRYKTNLPIMKSGFYREEWSNPTRKNHGKKRLNLETNQPFKRGDFNSDKTKIFWQYVNHSSDKDGFCYENWLTPEKYESACARSNEDSKKFKKSVKDNSLSGKYKKRINPSTGIEFKEGDRDENNLIFATYVNAEKTKDGYLGERWLNDEQFLARKLSVALASSKERAKQKNVEHNISLDYLYRIFPKDYVCPVFGTKMYWGQDRDNSPSLDRIVPDYGYVVGNVAFISGKANTYKLNRTPDILRKIADYVELCIDKANKT